GPTVPNTSCMQKVFGSPVSGSNKLNCTANDIRLSRAISVSPEKCTAGLKFNLTATFETVVTANARHHGDGIVLGQSVEYHRAGHESRWRFLRRPQCGNVQRHVHHTRRSLPGHQ